jgi:hypothetical protein
MHLRMLYNFARQNPPSGEDLYRPELVFPRAWAIAGQTDAERNVIRGFLKVATNACLNVESRGAANSVVSRKLMVHPQRDYLDDVIRTVEGLDIGCVIDRIVEVHPAIADRFFTEVGSELMTVDGKIMMHVLVAFADAGVPALPLHDAVLVRTSDMEFAEKTMAQTYHLFMTFPPDIKPVF